MLGQVQQRGLFPTRVIQSLQVQAQKRLISRALEQSEEAPRVPGGGRWLIGFQAVRHIPTRLIGYDIRREHVRTGEFLP